MREKFAFFSGGGGQLEAGGCGGMVDVPDVPAIAAVVAFRGFLWRWCSQMADPGRPSVSTNARGAIAGRGYIYCKIKKFLDGDAEPQVEWWVMDLISIFDFR